MPADPLDLLTLDQATGFLAAGNIDVSAALLTQLPAIITAASREMQRELHRIIPANNYDDVLRPTEGRPDRGEPATALLGQFPVLSDPTPVVQGGRVPLLHVTNTDSDSNQIARIALVCTGDPDVQITYSGLTLTRVSQAVTTTNTLLWADYPTVGALAAAVNAAGGGWSAVVTQGRATFAGWPTTELLGARESKPGFSPGTTLDVFSIDLDASIDRPSGIVRIGVGQPWAYGGFGWAQGGGWLDLEDSIDGPSGSGNQIRVRYRAGFEVIPAPLVYYAGLVVQAMAFRLGQNPALSQESAADYSYQARDALQALPDDVRSGLWKWTAWRV